jgi:hypothetical protein
MKQSTKLASLLKQAQKLFKDVDILSRTRPIDYIVLDRLDVVQHQLPIVEKYLSLAHDRVVESEASAKLHAKKGAATK